MKIFYEDDLAEVVTMLRAGKIGVIKTDTLYGLLCIADSQDSVERVYRAKGRDADKSPIVLIQTLQHLFDEPTQANRLYLNQVWPGKVSVVLSSIQAPDWIRRDNGSVAYRMPDYSWLNSVLAQTGPLIAPSANLQGYPVAQTLHQAIEYFGDTVDFYVDGGHVTDTTPSRLVRIHDDGSIEQLR